jgi:glucose 1-dehydrogenase
MDSLSPTTPSPMRAALHHCAAPNRQTSPTAGPLPQAVMPRCAPQKWLLGQKALVTGASSGIGRAIAIALGEAGADVVVNYASAEGPARDVAAAIEAAGSHAFVPKADVANESEVERMFAAMLGDFGTIDILVNNAGLQQDAAFEDLTLAQWNKVIGVNLTGQFLCARAAVREFKRRGVRPEISCSAGRSSHGPDT